MLAATKSQVGLGGVRGNAGPPAAAIGQAGVRQSHAISLLEEMKLKQEKRELRRKLKLELEELQASGSQDVVRMSNLRTQLTAVEVFLAQTDGLQSFAQQSSGSIPGNAQEEETTNLYVGSLAPEWTEELISREFGKYGNVSSIKIMYPRTKMQKLRGMNCGFVQFFSRRDAEMAKNNLNGKEFFGMCLRIDWGKAVSMPAFAPSAVLPPHLAGAAPQQQQLGMPMHALPAAAGLVAAATTDPQQQLQMLQQQQLLAAQQLQLQQQQLQAGNAAALGVAVPPPAVAPGADGATAPQSTERKQRFDIPKTLIIQIPDNRSIKDIIDKTAELVAAEGTPFETMLFEKEHANPKFAFMKLDNPEDPLHLYYKWRVYANASGDTGEQWRTDPFQLEENGPLLQPPSCEPKQASAPESAAQQPAVQQRRRGIGTGELAPEEWQRLDILISELATSRASILEAMAFCMDNAIASQMISHKLCASIIEAQSDLTPAQLQARLFLISDVLFNSHCTKAGASMYRRQFQELLPDVFEKLGEICDKLSPLALNSFQDRIIKLVRGWAEWSTFPPQFARGLEATLCCRGKDRPTREQLDRGLDRLGLPASVRDKMQQLRDEKDEASLRRVCRLRGLATGGSRHEILARLCCYETYWFDRESQEKSAQAQRREEVIFDPQLDGEALDEQDLRLLPELLEREREQERKSYGPSRGATLLLGGGDLRRFRRPPEMPLDASAGSLMARAAAGGPASASGSSAPPEEGAGPGSGAQPHHPGSDAERASDRRRRGLREVEQEMASYRASLDGPEDVIAMRCDQRRMQLLEAMAHEEAASALKVEGAKDASPGGLALQRRKSRDKAQASSSRSAQGRSTQEGSSPATAGAGRSRSRSPAGRRSAASGPKERQGSSRG